MLQIRIEKNPNIYRVIQINSDQTMFDLDFVISVVFEIEETDEPVFEIIRRNGVPADDAFPLFNEEGEVLDREEELVSKWFVKEGDEMHFTWGHKGKLKLILEETMEDMEKPYQCIDGAGHLYSSNKEVDLEDVNINLSIDLDELSHLDQLLEPDYMTLFKYADDLKKLKPWQYFENEDIIAFNIEDSTCFVSVMGAAGQDYGLMIFDEEEGYRSLAAILEGGYLPEDFHFDLSALTINYLDRAELDKTDYELIKDCGLSFRGKNNWIAFRSYEPGLEPIIPLFTEVEIMKLIIDGMIKVTLMRKNGWQYPQVASHEYPAFNVDYDENVEFVGLINVPKPQKNKLEIEVNDIEIARIKRNPKSNLELEYDMFYMPFGVSENDERTIYPVLYVVMNRLDGTVYVNEIMPFPKIPLIQQQAFWTMLLEVPIRPRKVYLKREMIDIIQPLAKLVGIELVISELPNIQKLKEMMKQMPPI